MALRWVDSFDGYTTAQLAAKYLYSGQVNIVSGEGRRGTNAAQPTTQNNCGLSFPMVQDPYTFLGFAMKPSSQDIVAASALCAFGNGGSTPLLAFAMNSTGGLDITGWQSNSALYLVAITPGGYIIANEYHQYELDIKWTTDTTGYVKFYRDSVLFCQITGIQTQTAYQAGRGQPTVCAFGNVPSISSGYATETTYFDDLYLCDSSGSAHNTGPIGDKKIVIMIPNGAGNETQFSVVGESDNWQAVSQNPPLYDSAYVSSTTIGDEDTYTLSTPATAFTAVDAIAVTVLARKDDAGDRTISAGIGNGTTQAYGTAYGLGADYTYAQTIFDGENPLTSAAFTPTDLTTLEAALKIES
jgi:hypothetical protein